VKPHAFAFLLAWICLPLSGQEPAKFTPLERLQPHHLEATRQARLQLARDRRPLPNLGVYEDFRAVIHVHAEDSDHTKGTRQEVLEAAKKTGVRVVMFTDHGGPHPETWRGIREGILFMAGEENSSAGLLRFPEFNPEGRPVQAGERQLRFLSHPEDRLDVLTEEFHGMEISNRHTDAKLDKSLQIRLMTAMLNPELWSNLVRAFQEYPDEFFGAGVDYRPEIFAKWDRELQAKKFTGIGANDAHQNQIINGVTFDPYEVSFRNLTTHILARELTEEAVVEALREGRAYVAHDWLCDPTGFAFHAANNLGVYTMGDPAPFLGTTRLHAYTPAPARLKLFHNGALIETAHGTNLTFRATETGAYRLEAWLNIAGEERPWIYANPVFLRAPAATDLTLPSSDLAPEVEVRKNISYRKEAGPDAAKQQLDIYIPRGKTGAPALVFLHGGSWKFGDRSQYPALGNRFAREGIVTVVPSYRLAPQHPHPAQIEDAAAAFAWVVENIAEHGGDPGQIWLAGHSAGGHLAVLLALDGNYLEAHQLTADKIRGVVSLSGVYDLTRGESPTSVFGSDPQTRKKASPQFHVKARTPPFLIAYCQWDYLSLPAQARAFHSALQEAGASSELLYIPERNHISIVAHLPKENDPAAEAILDFLKQRRGTDTNSETARAEEPTKPKFGIYLPKLDVYSATPDVRARVIDYLRTTDPSEIPLADHPVLTEAGLESYDWDNHTLHLRPGHNLWLTVRPPGTGGVPFVVVVENEPIYVGAFWTIFSSVPASAPVILWDDERKSNTLSIQPGFPAAIPDRKHDPRAHQKLKRVLEDLGIIRMADPK
jgi:acetyl esterase/lipase